jgi:hypothetical protein
MKHGVSQETGLCPRCTKIAARSQGTCTKCSRFTVIYNQHNWVCHPCHALLLRRVRSRARGEVECSVCGKVHPSFCVGRAICQACWRAERNGHAICVRCKKLKIIFGKAERLCRQCYKDHLAPKALCAYVENFTTPFPYNQVLFEILAATIDWQSVNQKTDRRFRVFGRFLQAHEFKEPLTWEAIEEALPALGQTNRNNPKLVRASLIDLGHVLAGKGKLESREAYAARRDALLPITQAPQYIQPLLERYATWLWERKTRPSNVCDHMEALASFWSWCNRRGIRSPAEVQTTLVKDYVLALYWQWQCSACGVTAEFEPRERRAPQTCGHCGALQSLTKVKRYAQNTVRLQRAKLLVFFDWCKIDRIVLMNPVQVKIPAPIPTIRHYPPEVIRQLCAYIAAVDSDPTEAISLYLILFHALSVWELRHVRIPVVRPLRQGTSVPSLSEAYYLIVPKPSPSLGDRSPGRPDVRLDFHPSAASWLRNLLDRYEHQRRQIVQNPANEYLFVSSMSARRDMPVGKAFFWHAIRRASLRVLGGACSPNILRKTVGIMFADRAGAGILHWMGWNDQQAFAYTWAERQMVRPRQDLSSNLPGSDPHAEPVVFPSPLNRTS